jgi:S-layer family protein
MKQFAVVIAAILSLALVAPAFAQPFADVPTDHWAYDAVAELAAKGLIEGYPDGAFRGDRAMTRYEMAMVVARLLARIEAIKIPPLPTDLVRTAQLNAANAANAAALRAVDQRLTAKLATIQRLVAEFRAELAALGVRVTAVEEELAALRARLDNTKITGDARMRYNVFPTGGPTSGSISTSRIRTRVTLTGTGGPNTSYVLRLFAANNLDAALYDVNMGEQSYHVVTWDLAYLDIRNTWGAQLWRVGRQFYTLGFAPPAGGGLLYDPNNSFGAGLFSGAAGAGTLGNNPLCFNVGVGATTCTLAPAGQRAALSEGIRSDWAFGPLNLTLALFRENALSNQGNFTSAFGAGGAGQRDFRIVRAWTGSLLPGWTLGGSYYQEYQYPTAAVNGGTGWGLDINGTLIPGLMVYADWASWNSRPTTFGASVGNASAWRIGGNLNFNTLFGGAVPWNPTLDFEYHNFGALPAGGIPPTFTYATTYLGQYHAWNMRGWLARLNLTFTPRTAGWILYEGGSIVSTGQSYNEWWLRLTHRVAANTTLALNYYRTSCGAAGTPCPGFLAGTGGVIDLFYRAELLYSW